MVDRTEGRAPANAQDSAPESFEAPLWRFVEDWPQVSAHLRRTLDAELIPCQAVAVLRRALDFNRVIGFIGSGVSMSYGRLGWGELIKWMACSAAGDRLRDRRTEGARRPPRPFFGVRPVDVLRADPQKGTPEATVRATLTRQRMERLLRDLEIDSRQDGDDLQSGRYPAAFQFLEQCARELAPAGERHGVETRVRRCLRSMLRDDGGHAYLLFERLLADLLDDEAPYTRSELESTAGLCGTLARHWASVHDHVSPDSRQDGEARSHPSSEPGWRSAFSVRPEGFEAFADALDTATLESRLCSDVKSALFVHEGLPLAPMHRFAVLALVRLDPAKACQTLWGEAGTDPARGERWRAEVVAAARDPLQMLLRDFGLSRLATTNYDLDIERALYDAGFDTADARRQPEHLPPAPGRVLARNALGMAAHDTVFRHAQAAELLRFATGRPSAVQVMHLHGRVFADEPLIVTEEDYQDLYMQRSDVAEAASDAIALAFRSNTVLFVGSGMSEDDVLRPLRQFVTERKSSADRSGVVLLPADGSRAREIDEVIANYSRYGVLTKHFGVGSTARKAGAGRPVRWLAQWLAIRAHLAAVTRQASAAAARPVPSPDEFRRLRLALPRLPQAPALEEVWQPKFINGCALAELPVSSGLGARFGQITEIALICSVTRVLEQVLRSAGNEGPGEADAPWLQVSANSKRAFAGLDTPTLDERSRPRLRRLLLALEALLDGLSASLRGLAMTLELSSLHRSWQLWKGERRVSPLIRPVGARRQPMKVELRSKRPALPDFIFSRNLLALRPAGPASGQWPAPGQPVPPTDRFMQQAPSHSFSKFIVALDRRVPDKVPPAEAGAPVPGVEGVGGRRTLLLLARRGLGKGHFFEMLAQPDNVAKFIESSWRAEGENFIVEGTNCCHPAYAVACYVNLGVSLEFLSAFDRLSLVLVDMAPAVFPREPAQAEHNVAWQIRLAAERLSKNRLARLQAILRLYAQNAPRAERRLLIAFNGFGQFFDRLGAPKNAQLHRLIDALIGPASAKVPIDVLMVCQDVDLPGQFKAGGLRMPIEHNTDLDGWKGLPADPMLHLVEPHPDERLRRKLDQTVQWLGLAMAPLPAGRGAWVHVMRGAHASATVGKYFPGVALALALATENLKLRLTCRPQDVRELQDAIVAVAQRHEDAVERLTLDVLASLTLAARPSPLKAVPQSLRQLLARAAARPGPLSGISAEQPMLDLLDAVLKVIEPEDPEHARAKREIDERFHRLHRTVRANRYLLTIVCAAAAERGWRPRDKQPPQWQFEPSEVEQWLKSVELEVSNHLEADAVDRIIGRVLASHQWQHEQGHMPLGWGQAVEPGTAVVAPAPAALRVQLANRLDGFRKACGAPAVDPAVAEKVLTRALCGPLAWRLQQRLLWHLAVMALEVQSDVLATAPLVEVDCALLTAEATGWPEAGRHREALRHGGINRLLVELMLDLLVHRCLVFRMEPVQLGPEEVIPHLHPASAAGFQAWYKDRFGDEPPQPSAESQAHSGWRFTIHRFLQRIILEQLKSPFIEFQKVDQFGLSLWATQPDELPRPDRSAAHDIADLVAAWIGFPKDADSMRDTSTFHWFRHDSRLAAAELADERADWDDAELWRRTTLPARMLRAALGVVRATYSVGVVSRFHGFDDGGGAAGPEEGYFKQHHLQVRWLIEQAKLLRSGEDLQALLNDTTRDVHGRRPWWGLAMEASTPFYVDELVWLNNECGLFCLVEGRLDNAAGMFRQALLAAEEVEGRDLHGALWCRIHLNLAIVEIERGRIREADEHLATIEGVADENPILRILARGFRALVEHLSGNLARAQERYEQVIKDLVLLGQLRAVAIFSRHLAELHRLQGPDAAIRSFEAIEQSIAAATRGGHEDIRHLAMLSRVRLCIAHALPPAVQEKAKNTVQTDLDAIEHYGVSMGMPRLLADVAFARALFLLNLGETRHAARLAHRCLELCVANGLRLRQMMGMALLGRIYRKRGLPQLAEPLFAQAYAMAVDCHYGNLREVAAHAEAGAVN